eukprot:gene42827-30113_t
MCVIGTVSGGGGKTATMDANLAAYTSEEALKKGAERLGGSDGRGGSTTFAVAKLGTESYRGAAAARHSDGRADIACAARTDACGSPCVISRTSAQRTVNDTTGAAHGEGGEAKEGTRARKRRRQQEQGSSMPAA